MLERAELFERDAALVTAFPPMPYCVAGCLTTAAAVPWAILVAPSLSFAAVPGGWAGEAALAAAIPAAAIMLVAAVGLAAADWWAETKSRRDWAAIGKAADAVPAPIGAPAVREDVYAPAVCNEALCSLFRAHRHAVRSSAPEPAIDIRSERAASPSVHSDAPLPAAASMAFSIAQASSSTASDAIPDANASQKVGPSGKTRPAPLHAREQLVDAVRTRRSPHLGGCFATQDRLVANAGPWRTWPGPDQRSGSHTIPIKIVSNIIVLGQGKHRPDGDAALPSPPPGERPEATIIAATARGPPRALHKSLPPEVSFEARRQLIALAQALAHQAAREDDAAERVIERSRSPPDLPVEIPPDDRAKER